MQLTDKKTIIIIILLAIYSIWINPLNAKIYSIHQQASLLERMISKERFIEKQKQQINKIFPAFIKINLQNTRLFFSPTESPTEIYSKIQSSIKTTAMKLNVIITNLNWGIPVKKNNYSVLSLSLTCNGSPASLAHFLERLKSNKKLLLIQQLEAFKSYSRNSLRMRINLTAYKLNKGVKNK